MVSRKDLPNKAMDKFRPVDLQSSASVLRSQGSRSMEDEEILTHTSFTISHRFALQVRLRCLNN